MSPMRTAPLHKMPAPMKRPLRWIVLMCLAALMLALPVEAAMLRVSPEAIASFPEDAQHRTIQAAVDAAGPGDVIVVEAGTYRQTLTITRGGTPEQPLRIEAAPGAKVVLTGADRLTDWRREGGGEGEGVFSHDWPHVFLEESKRRTHPDDDRHRLIGRVEQVIDGGHLLRQVLDRGHLAPGSFFVDEKAKRLYASPADGGDYLKEDRVVEASVRPRVVWVKASHVEVNGLTIRYAANAAQHGAAEFAAAEVSVRDCVFELTSGAGATVTSPGVTLTGCTFRDNGHIGLSGSGCHDLRIVDCTFTGNNAEGFDPDWEAGGAKLTLARGVRVTGSRFERNRGPGLWFDIGCEDVEVDDCRFIENDGSGLFYEISYGLTATGNTARQNGLADTPGGWGSQAGITISSSEGCVLKDNTLIGNREGLALREQDRKTPRIDGGDKEVPVRVRDLQVTGNTLAYNREAQVHGWFDVDDDRLWPPKLEKLGLVFDDNTFAMRPGQALWVWGVPWRKQATYATPEEADAALGRASGSRVVEEVTAAEPRDSSPRHQ